MSWLYHNAPHLKTRRQQWQRDPAIFYDPYFTNTAVDRLDYWNERKFRNVRVEDVSCTHCKYKPQHGVLDPKAAFAQHLRLRHPEIKARQKLFIITEEDDLAFS